MPVTPPTAIVPTIKPGTFFIRDARCHLYAAKRASSICDYVEYQYPLPNTVDKKTPVSYQLDDVGAAADRGLGSAAGVEYGGVYATDSSGTLRLRFTDENKQPQLGPTSRLMLRSRRFGTNLKTPLETVVGAKTLEAAVEARHRTTLSKPDFFGIDEFANSHDTRNAVLSYPNCFDEDPTLAQPRLVTKVPGRKYSTAIWTASRQPVPSLIDGADMIHNHYWSIPTGSLLANTGDVLEFLEEGDTVYLTLNQHGLMTVKTMAALNQLVVSTLPDGQAIRCLEDQAHIYLAVYDEQTGTQALVQKPSLVTLRTGQQIPFPLWAIRIPLRVRAVNGQIHNAANLYLDNGILNSAQPDQFSGPITDLLLGLMDYYGGLPRELVIWFGTEPVQLAGIVNRGPRAPYSPAETTIDLWRLQDLDAYGNSMTSDQETPPRPLSLRQLIFTEYDPAKGATIMLVGDGTGYEQEDIVFFDEMKKVIKLPGRPAGSPVVLTDVWASELDDVDVAGSYFSIDGNLLTLSGDTKNLINNPTFAQGLNGWCRRDDSLNYAELVSSTDRAVVKLYDRSLCVKPGGWAATYVWLPNEGASHSLSAFVTPGSRDDARLRISVISMAGARPTTYPMLDESQATRIVGHPKQLTAGWARLGVAVNHLKPGLMSGATQLAPDGALMANVPQGSHLVWFKFQNEGTTPIWIGGVQLELGQSATRFITHYDPLLVELETSSRWYVGQLRLDKNTSLLEGAQLQFEVTGNDLWDAGSSTDVTLMSRVRAQASLRPYAKLEGANKLPYAAPDVALRPRRVPHYSYTPGRSPTQLQVLGIMRPVMADAPFLLRGRLSDAADNPMPGQLVTCHLGRESLLLSIDRDAEISLTAKTDSQGIATFALQAPRALEAWPWQPAPGWAPVELGSINGYWHDGEYAWLSRVRNGVLQVTPCQGKAAVLVDAFCNLDIPAGAELVPWPDSTVWNPGEGWRLHVGKIPYHQNLGPGAYDVETLGSGSGAVLYRNELLQVEHILWSDSFRSTRIKMPLIDKRDGQLMRAVFDPSSASVKRGSVQVAAGTSMLYSSLDETGLPGACYYSEGGQYIRLPDGTQLPAEASFEPGGLAQKLLDWRGRHLSRAVISSIEVQDAADQAYVADQLSQQGLTSRYGNQFQRWLRVFYDIRLYARLSHGMLAASSTITVHHPGPR